MTNNVVYINAKQNAEVMDAKVCVKHIASVYCAQKEICAKVKALTVYRFLEDTAGKKSQRKVISILKVIELIEEACPGVRVESVGENAVLIEYIKVSREKGIWPFLKLAFVAGISFFGTAFTIASFHNDTDINVLFSQVYEMVMGRESSGYSILEVSYSIGLAIGIIVFFNHVGKRRITKDPTPIEVEMREYESLVNTALIETADREGDMFDVS